MNWVVMRRTAVPVDSGHGLTASPILSRILRSVAVLAWCICWLALSNGAPVAAVGVNEDEEIVYIDPAGVIRVLDPVQTADNRAVQWVSPDAGWVDIALGDVTGDGSLEIIAVGQEGGGGKLAIFDPVFTGSNPIPEQQYNEIAWVTYFRTQFPTAPSFVETGHFEGGDGPIQIVLSRPLLPQELTNPFYQHRLQIWRTGGDPPNPSAWSVIAEFDSPYAWQWIATGDFTGNGVDEGGIIDPVRGHLGVFRLGTNNNLEWIYANENADRPWRKVIFGQFAVSSVEEMVAIRNSSVLHTWWIFRWSNNQVIDYLSSFYLPPPDYIFLADMGGNGDMEVVVLRTVTPEFGDRARLFVRDNNNDPIALRDAALDADNGYLAGVGADLNADGRDAIVLIRNDRIRIYFEPYRNREYSEYPLPTNERTVYAGNLDAAGQQPVPRLDVTPDTLSLNVVQGQIDSTLRAEVISADIPGELIFTASTEPAAAWLSVTPVAGQTPQTLSIEIDARTLNAGTYSSAVSIESDSFDVPQSVDLDVSVTVMPGIRLNPAEGTIFAAPCTPDSPPRTLTFAVDGASGTPFQAELFPEAAWISVQPTGGTVPTQLTVTVRPSELSAVDSVQAGLLVTANNNGASAFRPEATILVQCEESTLFLPVAGNGIAQDP